MEMKAKCALYIRKHHLSIVTSGHSSGEYKKIGRETFQIIFQIRDNCQGLE